MSAREAEVRQSIADNARRLEEASAGGEELSQRVKKRILANLGKLKKELAECAEQGSKRKLDQISSDDGQEVPAQTELSKEERKIKLRIMNKDLADLAQKKQLKLAVKKFEWGVRKGLRVDVHSYSNLLNAHVRCNDLAGAEGVIARMTKDGISPNLVTLTILMKGFSEAGDVRRVSEIYAQVLAGPWEQNVRSLNTLLRGCSRTGAVKPALQGFFDFRHPKSAPTGTGAADTDAAGTGADAGAGGNFGDGSTFEYLVGILCRAGQLALAEVVINSFASSSSGGSKSAGGVEAIENIAVYLSMGTLCALVGDLSDAHKWMRLASEGVKIQESSALKEKMLKRFNDVVEEGGRSVALFLRHRRAELENQLMLLQDFVGHSATSPMRNRLVYLRCISQVFYFGFDGTGDYDDTQLSEDAKSFFKMKKLKKENARVEEERGMASIAGRMVLALRDKFGLDVFATVGGTVAGAVGKEVQALPVKLEICSGDGEWVVAQASADYEAASRAQTGGYSQVPKALWLSLELRCDRVQRTLVQQILSNPSLLTHSREINNLAILGGDASKILPSRIPPCSISAIFINHPQPPERVAGAGFGGRDKNQGAHLLTEGFFKDMGRVLKTHGTITIVTDNLSYAKTLAASVAAMPLLTGASGAQERCLLVSGVDRQDSSRGDWDHALDDSHPCLAAQNTPLSPLHGSSVDVWRGEPGPEVGHIAAASSYFDRMWDLGQKKRRWIIFLRKAPLDPLGPQDPLDPVDPQDPQDPL